MYFVCNLMKTVIIVFVTIFMIVIYEYRELSGLGLFITIVCMIFLLLFLLRILEGTPTYLRVGQAYGVQHCFVLPNDQWYILSLKEACGGSLSSDIATIYFVKKIAVVGNFSNRKQIIPSKFLVVRKEDDTFFLRAIK